MTETLHTPQERMLTDGLDFYKLSMGQVAFEKHPDAEVTFTMKNRAAERPLGEYVNIDELQARFNEIIERSFQPEEYAYLAGLTAQDGSARFSEEYLDYLANLTLTDVNVTRDPETQDLKIDATGPWANVSLWETIVMSEVNEQYYKHYIAAKGLDINEILAEGDRRLSEKITRLADRPDIKFSDFGTRRRFSARWHEHVIGRLAQELPDSFIGTSNPWFAHKFGITPIGTYAHEMPMVYSALADAEGRNPLDGHRDMMQDWQDRYQGDLSIALTDTFTTKFFFNDLTPTQTEHWKGLRHDSGDPVEFGELAIAHYEQHGINPNTKTLVFSDGLDIDTIIQLADHFKGRINVLFGWGTSLMNDLGLKANNFVMKATNVNGIDTVKLSDNEGKHTGPEAQVQRYIQLKDARNDVARAFANA